MRRNKPLLPLAAAAIGLTGCTPVEMRAEHPQGAERRCEAQPVQDYLGRPGEAGAIEGIRRASGAKVVRVVRPGEMMTMDFRPDRVTVTVDGHRIITRIACG
jgi:hypothetical protein